MPNTHLSFGLSQAPERKATGERTRTGAARRGVRGSVCPGPRRWRGTRQGQEGWGRICPGHRRAPGLRACCPRTGPRSRSASLVRAHAHTPLAGPAPALPWTKGQKGSNGRRKVPKACATAAADRRAHPRASGWITRSEPPVAAAAREQPARAACCSPLLRSLRLTQSFHLVQPAH